MKKGFSVSVTLSLSLSLVRRKRNVEGRESSVTRFFFATKFAKSEIRFQRWKTGNQECFYEEGERVAENDGFRRGEAAERRRGGGGEAAEKRQSGSGERELFWLTFRFSLGGNGGRFSRGLLPVSFRSYGRE